MKIQHRPDRALLSTAKSIAKRLKFESRVAQLRIRIPGRCFGSNTDGWYAIIGDLGRSRPRLEVWLDRFSGHSERKLFACFRSEIRPQIASVTKAVSKKLWPVREILLTDTTEEKYLKLSKRLARSEFNAPILEKYPGGRTFYGIYDPTLGTSEKVISNFCARAVSFFEDVAQALPQAAAVDEHREVYPRYENRKRVASHLQRERSGLLATECKIRDNYQCQVCKLRFEDFYGKLGVKFAEAHHRVPLSKLHAHIRTKLSDLATVCANCHRMLHRMEGKRNDLEKLAIVINKHVKRRR